MPDKGVTGTEKKMKLQEGLFSSDKLQKLTPQDDAWEKAENYIKGNLYRNHGGVKSVEYDKKDDKYRITLEKGHTFWTKLQEGNLGHSEEWSLEPEGRFWILTYRTMDGKKEKVFNSEDEANQWIKQNLSEQKLRSVIRGIIKEELEEAIDQGPVSIKGKTGPTGGTPKIPRALFLDKEVINTINNVQPGSIKLISKPGDKRVYMYVSSFVKNALDELERGRSSREKLKKQSKLADTLSDALPSSIRGKIKKEINPKMDSGLEMHYVDLNISPKKDKTGYWILAKGESEPLVSEELEEK